MLINESKNNIMKKEHHKSEFEGKTQFQQSLGIPSRNDKSHLEGISSNINKGHHINLLKKRTRLGHLGRRPGSRIGGRSSN